MRRGRLFFIGLLSAIITIVSLNIAFGRPGYYNRHFNRYERFHRCEERYNDNRRDDKKLQHENNQNKDSLNNNY